MASILDGRIMKAAMAALALSGLSGCASGGWFGGGDAAETAAAPALAGRSHRVVKGDTVFGISRRYGVPAAEIRRANQLDDRYSIHVGQHLLIPGPTAGAVAAASAGRAAAPVKARQRRADAAAAIGPRRLQRPVEGEIVRAFGDGVGARRNAGVDIAAPAGAPVAAAADGKIAFVSDPTSPVGAVILMQHSGGMNTIYGRLTDISVRVGQQVAAGAPIARIAPRSGDAPALHFELRHGSEPVNPTPYL